MGNDKKRKRSLSPSNVYHKNFKSFLSTFRNSDEFSDMTIKCQSRLWKVHRVILSPQSDWFKIACSKGFKEGDTRIIELDSDNPVIVEMMIQFFYSLNYNDGASTKQKINNQVTNAIQSNGDEQGLTNSSPLLNNALVYAMADKYQVKWLKDRAISKTWHRLSENFKLKEFSDAIDTVWTSTPSSDNRMRSLYLENFLIRRCEILSGSDADTSLIWANNDFLRDVIRAEAEVLQGDNQSTLGIRMSLKCTIHNSEEEPTCRHYHDNGRSRVELKFKLNYNEPKTSMFKEP